jgi:hypothetical protein
MEINRVFQKRILAFFRALWYSHPQQGFDGKKYACGRLKRAAGRCEAVGKQAEYLPELPPERHGSVGSDGLPVTAVLRGIRCTGYPNKRWYRDHPPSVSPRETEGVLIGRNETKKG